MNRSKLYLTIGLALVLAGAASLLVVKELNQKNGSQPTAMVLVAAKDLDVGTALGPADFKVVAWSGDQLPKGALLKSADATGRAVLYPLSENEMIIEGKLAPIGAGAGLPAVIPQGMRAVSIRVDDVVAVAGYVMPGTRVDVLLTGTPGNRTDALTRTILENVLVLAAGQKFQPDGQGRPEKVSVVTLLCSGEDAARVTLGANEGRIQLILRNPMDTKKRDHAASVVRSALYGEQKEPVRQVIRVPVKAAVAAPAPAPPPPAPVADKPRPEAPSITVIRGNGVTKVIVAESNSQVINR